jgi:hypothetical protein
LRPILDKLAGMSARAIAAELNRRKIETPAGGQWHAVTAVTAICARSPMRWLRLLRGRYRCPGVGRPRSAAQSLYASGRKYHGDYTRNRMPCRSHACCRARQSSRSVPSRRDARAGRSIHRLSTDTAAFRSPGVLELKESNFRRIAWFWRRASVSASSSLSSEPLQSSRTQPKCHNHHEVGNGSEGYSCPCSGV